MQTESDTNVAIAGCLGELSRLQGPDEEVAIPLDPQR